ncbi:MAG: DUF2586 family protein [Microbacteriaceae bacterium]
MTIPSITNTEVQGGIIAVGAPSKLLLVLGTASQGPTLQITRQSSPSGFVSTFGFGHGVNYAAVAAQAGRQTAFMRLTQTAGSCAAVVQIGGGTSVATVNALNDEPFDDFDIIVQVTKAGTIGVFGAAIKYSLNGGLDFSPSIPLGTANNFTIPNTGVRLDFAAGTLVLNATYSVKCTGPAYDDAAITAAFDVIKLGSLRPDCVVLAGATDATSAGVFANAIKGLKPFGIHMWGLCEARVNDFTNETYAQYTTSIASSFHDVATDLVGIGAWAARVPSPIYGVRLRRSQLMMAVGALTPESISENPASIGGHALNGTLRDDAGNLVEHDAFFDEGLADQFICARSWPNQPGTYVTRAQLKSAPASSIQLSIHRRLVNEAERVADAVSASLVHLPVKAKPDGTISDLSAKHIEAAFNTGLNDAVAPHCSAVQWVLDRTFNVITSKKIKGRLQIQPFGYPEFFETEIYLTSTVA